jgi:gamma-glutamyltranspeptidase/glutathione hydrolase
MAGNITEAGVTAAHHDAVAAGVDALERGGNAVDAAVATAFALTVVDPANCGIGGHGGAMVISLAGNTKVMQVNFNTKAPREIDLRALRDAPKTWNFRYGPATVTVPAVCAGLLAAQRKFGRLERKTVLAPAIELAEKGVTVSADLARSLQWAERYHGGLTVDFKSVFFKDGRPLTQGAMLRQPELARTLRLVAQQGEAAFSDGGLASQIASSVCAGGGFLTETDIIEYQPHIASADECNYEDALVFGVAALESGFEILSRALVELNGRNLGQNRSASYIDQLTCALTAGWIQRRSRTKSIETEQGHTSHLCAVDTEGSVVSLTFTHGPLWFGAGVLVPETGIILNCGANLLRRVEVGSATNVTALHNLCPVVIRDKNGTVYAFGSPGGSRIPAIVLQAVVDVIHYRLPLDESICLPRVSVDPSGGIEVELLLRQVAPDAYLIERHEYYGPASGLTLTRDGRLLCALDYRFQPAFLRASPRL